MQICNKQEWLWLKELMAIPTWASNSLEVCSLLKAILVHTSHTCNTPWIWCISMLTGIQALKDALDTLAVEQPPGIQWTCIMLLWCTIINYMVITKLGSILATREAQRSCKIPPIENRNHSLKSSKLSNQATPIPLRTQIHALTPGVAPAPPTVSKTPPAKVWNWTKTLFWNPSTKPNLRNNQRKTRVK